MLWNPWHGCVKYSEGCRNCYVYRRDESIGKDASFVYRTESFDLPMRKKRNGEYIIPPGSSVFACMTSDFFLDDADKWREEAWKMIRQRSDVHFSIITKRIARFMQCIPADWDSGYENVSIGCTVESQRQCDIRLPLFMEAPIRHRFIICEPLLEAVDMTDYLSSDIEEVVAGGESGPGARICNYEWVLSVREQCLRSGVPFHFKQTGAKFLKDGILYNIPRRLQQPQAAKANIDLKKQLP